MKNLISLRDDNERALTYTLGYVIANSHHLSRKLLKHALGKDVSRRITSVEIEPSIPELHSRYDILVRVDNKPRLIVEGKRHRETPSLAQCWKYVKYLKTEGNQTQAAQRLLLVFDWLQEDEIAREMSKLRQQLDKKLKRSQQVWRTKAEHYVRYLTWDQIWEWCECILRADKSALCESEAKLLADYKNYLELDRYGHECLDSLALDRGKQLRHVFHELEKIRMRYDMTLNRIPGQGDGNQDCLYAWGESTRSYQEGFFGYKKGIHNIFGLVFRWRGKAVREAYIYITLPRKRELPRKLQSALEGSCIDGEYRSGEWWFMLDLSGRDRVDEAIHRLAGNGFFRTAIQKAQS